MTVHLVHLKTSGEVWHTAVCENQQAAETVLQGYGITECVYGASAQSITYEFQVWRSRVDPSQTASVVVRDVVMAR